MDKTQSSICPSCKVPFTWHQAVKSSAEVRCVYDGRLALKAVHYIQCPTCGCSAKMGANGWEKGVSVTYRFTDEEIVEGDTQEPAAEQDTVTENEVETKDIEVDLDKFGNEIYLCEKCQRNHRVESRIGKEHEKWRTVATAISE